MNVPIGDTPDFRFVASIVKACLWGHAPVDSGVVPSPSMWQGILGVADEHRVLGILSTAEQQGLLTLDDTMLEALTARHVDLLHNCLVIESALLAALDVLDAAGIGSIVLKGVAVAHLDYPEPAMRSFEDVDLLIPATQIDDAIRLLIQHGHRRDLPPRRRDWDRRFSKDITMFSPQGPAVDVHRTVLPGAFGFWVNPSGLFEDPTSFVLGGRPVRGLGPEARSLHAACALSIGENLPRLSHACDLALILAGGASTSALAELAERWRLSAVLADALDTTVRWLGSAVLAEEVHELRSSLAGSRSERFVLGTYHAKSGSNTATLLAGVLGLRSSRDRIAYLGGLLRPDRTYRASRAMSGRSVEWSTALRELMKR